MSLMTRTHHQTLFE